MGVLRRCLGVGLCVALIFLAVPAMARPAPESFADLVDGLMPSVVNIASKQTVQEQDTPPIVSIPDFPDGSPFNDLFKEFMDRFGEPGQMQGAPRQPETSLGSGFIISEDGLVVTNHHVIADAEEITVILPDNTEVVAEVLGSDPKTDLGLLKIKTSKKLKPIRWGNSDAMRVGDWVVAIGNPFGLGGTVTAGIISARARDINAGPYDDFLQTDASINRGNSGGPMFNMDGEVIGINTAIFSPTGGSVGIGFAIPANMAHSVIAQLQKYGHTRRGWLGVRIQAVTDEIAASIGLDSARGALVAEVTPDGPAAAAGLQQGDVIVEFNGADVSEMRKLPRLVAETDIGSKAKVTVWRQGKTLTRTVKVGELEAAEQAELAANDNGQPSSPAAPAEKELLGLTLQDISPALAQRMDLQINSGVVITAINPRSAAADNGLRPGDVVREVAQQPVQSVKQMEELVKRTLQKQDGKKQKAPILLLIDRRGESRYVALKVMQEKAK